MDVEVKDLSFLPLPTGVSILPDCVTLANPSKNFASGELAGKCRRSERKKLTQKVSKFINRKGLYQWTTISLCSRGLTDAFCYINR